MQGRLLKKKILNITLHYIYLKAVVLPEMSKIYLNRTQISRKSQSQCNVSQLKSHILNNLKKVWNDGDDLKNVLITLKRYYKI